jgi:adenylate cyclase
MAAKTAKAAKATRPRNILMIGRSLAIGLGIGLLTFFLARGVLSPLELFASDLLFRIRGVNPEESPVILVAIDDASFTQNGLQWPWPRDYLARIVDGIATGDPKVIAIDVLFYEATTPDQDQELARALRDAGNVILVNNISSESQGGITISQYNRPIPELDAVATLGLTNFPRDDDGKVRRLLAFQAHNDQLYFAWSMQAARLYLDAADFVVRSANEVWIGDHRVKLDNQLIVDFRGRTEDSTVPTYSAYQVVEGYVDPRVFEGKIVIIGATSPSLHDDYPTPYGGEAMPGAEINAHAIDTLLNSRYITSVGGVGHLAIAVLAGLIGALLTLRARPVAGLVIMGVLILLYSLMSFVLFIQARVIMPFVAPVLGMGLVFITNTSIQLYEEQRERARVRSLFDRYVSSAAIDQMLSQPDSYALSGQRREMTIMFSDIRGFTSLSEQLTPDQVVEILNHYLGVMTEIVFKHEGAIDKFEGDAILAIWNAPLEVKDHPTKAIQCAIEMAHRLSEMQQEWAATGQRVLRNGIGINTGMCFVGNIGSAQRMDYTVIGDTVNLAARLEALTKEVGVQILFTRETRDKLTEDIRSRFVASATVKGREKPVEIYTVDPDYHQIHVDEGVVLDQMPATIAQVSKDKE